MAKTTIKIENIGKKYTIGEAEPYLALRDIIANAFNPKKWFIKNDQNQFWALRDVNCEVQQGEVLGLIGHNGAGKSTLLKILSQITPPTTGKITLNGRVASLLEVGTGFHPELTGRENIFLNGAILGMTKNEIYKKFDEIVAFADIEKFLDTPVKRYSSGMYVRLAFAVAAHLESEILLVDEVLAVGDLNFQKKCLGKMNEVTQQKGRTIIFVSHNMGAIQKLCKKCILLKTGSIEMIGDTKSVVENYINIGDSLAKTPLSERIDRSGNGTIKLVDFFIADQERKKIKYIKSGDNIYLNFKLKKFVLENLKDIELHITIRTAQENKLFLHKTTYSKLNIKMDKDELNLGCFIKHIPLASGTYIIGTEIYINNKIVDLITSAIYFDVVMGDFFQNGISYQEGHSPLLLDGGWVISS